MIAILGAAWDAVGRALATAHRVILHAARVCMGFAIGSIVAWDGLVTINDTAELHLGDTTASIVMLLGGLLNAILAWLGLLFSVPTRSGRGTAPFCPTSLLPRSPSSASTPRARMPA